MNLENNTLVITSGTGSLGEAMIVGIPEEHEPSVQYPYRFVQAS